MNLKLKQENLFIQLLTNIRMQLNLELRINHQGLKRQPLKLLKHQLLNRLKWHLLLMKRRR